MDIPRELALRSDPEVQQALNRMINGLSAAERGLGALLASPAEMQKLVALVEPNAENSARLSQLKQEARAVRAILLLSADDAQLRPRLAAALTQDRKTRDPLIAALVLSGIVLVLSTKFELDYQNKEGKKIFSFKIKKEATPTEILKKFFGLFGGG